MSFCIQNMQEKDNVRRQLMTRKKTHHSLSILRSLYTFQFVLRWDFMKDNKKVRIQENTLSAKKAIKKKRKKKTSSWPRKQSRKKMITVKKKKKENML